LATDPAWAGLQGALQQLAACLAVARGRPLQAAAIQALAAAEEVVQTTWLRTSTEADGQDGAPLPQALLSQWKDTHGQLQQARLTFAQSVQTYNFAITQFPAGILAWLFGFRLATAL
jgi:LemA protein